MNARRPPLAALTLFALVPVFLYWYGAGHCQELSCLGPPANLVLAVVVVVPLLVLWRTRRRAIYPSMLVCSEAAMTVATFRRDFDFSPQFSVVAAGIGLVAGLVIGQILSLILRTRRPRRP